ncbi:upstream transcription factor 1, usf1, putative [Schistosoma mansoni]|uniref:upstream transcription factor 1, usf1, putative n=1 Tax=Schistosoma mansoni TaxID=6183 RepID=UPI00022C8529|nr:upstream transcription factor 1, usf1, putative [Schistosoma mansoni]|eukprot:XP_018647313.1 upstream transcription factor 1, usf1, putative [Schistosoma mansoni]
MDDAVKLSAIKISRQSQPLESDGLTVINTSETNAMSVLPRLLRTMTSRNSQAANDNQSGVENNQISNGELCFSVSIPGSAVNDSDSSSSSSSSFMSTPSSGSSLISFLSPGHLGPVAAMAAVALSTAVTTMSVNDIQESSGLVTLATASSLIEKEWRARASVVNSNNESVNNVKEHAETTLTVQHHTDLLTSTIQGNIDRNQQFALDGSPPLVIGALNTSPSQSLLNESTPVTRAVLNVQSLAAFIRETQKQCSISSPTTSIELPLTSVFPLQTETKLTSSCNVRQVSSPSYLLPSASTPSFLPMTPVPQNLPTVLEQPLHSESVAVNHNTHPSPPIQSTAFISLQPAPGSLISPSDLQQLVASGEFMSSAARQTLLGQSSDGSTRQLYLLVPSDCPVIMPRVSNNQPTMTPILPSTSPLIESIPTSAPILEAISPGVEPEENNVQMQSESSTCNNAQQVLTSVSHLATTMLNPMSSASTTALSTFLAGLEARNHRPIQQIQLGGLPLSAVTSSLSCSYSDSSSTYTAKDSSAPSCPQLRIPLQVSGLPISENGSLSVEQNVYPVTNNIANSILGVVKNKTPQLPTSSKSNTSIDECRRNSVTNTILNTSNNRSEQVKGSTTYLEHLNPESKDIRRRVSHNEVERRRRDRINTWISELYKLLPPDEQTKSQYQSKGIVLKRVCEYFQNVDSMLKAANSAVEQIRVENSILRQRVHELQQENQLLSASLQLGAVAAAAHLKNRQPRPGSSLSSININTTNEGNIITTTNNNSGTIPGVGIVSTLTNNENCTILKDSIEFTDYQSPLTVFTVDTPNHHHHHNSNSNNHNVNFNQTNSNCITPTSSLNNNQSSCFTSLASINSIGGFNVNQTISPTNTSSSSTSEIIHQALKRGITHLKEPVLLHINI